ncbi:hypothetical protein BDR26DRAFT_895088 [Obelidium mucronatum]|nr:hypothetical protein BDR26DRAFT_895088 [Obelidium mucronatum]
MLQQRRETISTTGDPITVQDIGIASLVLLLAVLGFCLALQRRRRRPDDDDRHQSSRNDAPALQRKLTETLPRYTPRYSQLLESGEIMIMASTEVNVPELVATSDSSKSSQVSVSIAEEPDVALSYVVS